MKTFLAQVRHFWAFIGLAILTLVLVEGAGYLVGTALRPYGAIHPIATSLICLLGYLICRGHGGDVGRTMAQLYLIDFALHVAGLLIYLTAPDGVVTKTLYFLYNSANIGLGICKVLVLSSMLTYTDQPGWPSLIPRVTFQRIIEGDQLHDQRIRYSVLAAMLLGGWIQWRDFPYELAIFTAPMFILIYIVRSQRHWMNTKAGAIPEDALAVARELNEISDPEMRGVLIKHTNDAIKRMKSNKIRGGPSWE